MSTFRKATLNTSLAVLFAGMLAVVATAPAHAEAMDTTSAPVSVQGLDLATLSGQAALLQRVTHAAARLCAPADQRDLYTSAATQACEQAAIASTYAQMQHAIAVAQRPQYAAIQPKP